jgi:hypothetical protein
MPCTPGETLKLYIALGLFVLVLNVLFFFAHPDLTICFLSAVGHLKMFRAAGSYVQLSALCTALRPAIFSKKRLCFELVCRMGRDLPQVAQASRAC